jgi:hypothetical protein
MVGSQSLTSSGDKTMNKKILSVIFVTVFLFSISVIPQISYCQTATPRSTLGVSPTEAAEQASAPDMLLIGIIIVVVVALVGAVVAFVLFTKKRVNEKSLKKMSSRTFEEWVIKKFNGKPSDPTTGVNGLTEGGQPLLIIQSDHAGLAEINDFVDVLVKGRAQKGTIVAFNFDNDTIEGKVKAMDHEIELQLLRINELLNKRFANKISNLASAQVKFEPQLRNKPTDQGIHPGFAVEEGPQIASTVEGTLNEPRRDGLKPRVFVSNSNMKVADQVKKMLEFIHYDYVMGDKENMTVPISDGNLGLMKGCDCAIINIAAAEQERRYSGMYSLNANVTSEINAAYLKYNKQVVLLVERKIDLPPNLKGLKRIEYDSDDLSFNAAMELEKVLAGFKKI